MDIDDLIAAISTCQTSSGRSLKSVVESLVRRRLSGAYVSVCDAGSAMAASRVWTQDGPGALRIPVPVRPGVRATLLLVRPHPGRTLAAAEVQFLERVAAVYALAACGESGPGLAPHDDDLVRDGAAPLIGHSPAMQALRERMSRVACTDFTVLVEGESGSGKELVARQVHELSRRCRGPFVAVNCAAIVETLLEAELFGIEDRTATGVRGRRGKFEQASGGTLFLDEVADLSQTAQAKLLRAIQDLAVERVGGQQVRRVDIRIIVATNKRLRLLVERGSFREDLYYRLSGVELVVPALRTRREDVPELARYFLQRHRAVRPLELLPAAGDALAAYDWPGNVRELERTIESALALTSGDRLDVADLPPAFRGPYADVVQASVQRRDSLREWSRRYVSLVFQRCHENKREACRVLGISYHTLQAHLRQSAAGSYGVHCGGPTVVPDAAMVHERGSFGGESREAGIGDA